MASTKTLQKDAAGFNPVKFISDLGVKSEHAYIGAFVSIGVSLIAWSASRGNKHDDKSQSDRWGIFIGHWAPTFFGLGLALRQYEND